MSKPADPRRITSLDPEGAGDSSPLRLVVCGDFQNGKSSMLEILVGSSEQPGVSGKRDILFTDDNRNYSIVEPPGHELYTEELIESAAGADAAIILIDATRGISEQTRRHAVIASLLDIRALVIAVNKMDRLEYSEKVFSAISEACTDIIGRLQFTSTQIVPVSALNGDNIRQRSARTPWYTGSTVLDCLAVLEGRPANAEYPFRFPIEEVTPANADLSGYTGTPVAGSVSLGDEVRVLPSGQVAIVSDIQCNQQHVHSAGPGQPVSITLDRDLDVSRGCLLTPAAAPCEIADQFDVSLIWLNEANGFVGRSYEMILGNNQVHATLTGIKYKYNFQTLEQLTTHRFERNEIGRATLSLDQALPYEPYTDCPALGSFQLRDRYSHEVIAKGLINFSLRRAQNVHIQALSIDKAAREQLNGHRGKVLWFTGLSGSGKSTIANATEQALHSRGIHTYILDGDNIRHGLNKDLGFTDADRVENIRRIAEVAKLMVDAGLLVLTAFISPFRSERDMARAMFDAGDFIEIYVDVPLNVAEARDPKGLYKKARRGELPNFTGIGSAYQAPVAAEVSLPSADLTIQECVDRVLEFI